MATVQLIHGIGVAMLIAGFMTAIGVIAASLIPQWRRIVRLALGNVELGGWVSDGISHRTLAGARGRCPQTQDYT